MKKYQASKQRISGIARTAALAALLGAAGFAGYRLTLRPWQLRWGAMPEEVHAAMPGDDVVEQPTYISTRAITIVARPVEVWQWLVQLGQGRGGMYSYTWIENLGGLKMENAAQILPEYQHLTPGDVIPLAPNGSGPRVRSIEPNRALVLEFEGGWTWTFLLVPLDARRTRLVIRNRWSTAGMNLAAKLFFLLVLDFGDFVMERKMMLGIKQRAEQMDINVAQFAPELSEQQVETIAG